MALFENFPYTNLHELNLDWLIKEIEEMKEGQVLSVNGQTGDVILYQDNDILFPAVTDSHWSMVRSADGTTRGIMFGNDDKAYIVHGSTMEQIYSASNQPPYPVESVNGKTGAVSLFTDNNGVVSFPAVNDPDIEGIIIGRSLNGEALYLKLNDDGTASITKGSNEENIYTTADTDLNVFPLPEAEATETGTNNKQWGVVREVNSGDIGLLFNLGETPEVFIRYRDAGQNWQNVKLLTNDDIPSSAGVVSFNGETGVVTVDGSDLEVSGSDSRTIAQAISDSAVTDYAIKRSIAYVENTNTASQNIPSDAYVIWQNADYISTQAISIGDTLSGTNLSALSDGGITNDLRTVVDTLNSKIGRIISSGSLHDITEPGIYWLTSAVTDKPENDAGLYVLSIYNTDYLAALYISVASDHAYSIRNAGGWEYEYIPYKKSYNVTATTSSTGAVPVENAYKQYTFIGGHLTTGGPGFVFRRDEDFFTVFNNNGVPLANTPVAFTAVFIA